MENMDNAQHIRVTSSKILDSISTTGNVRVSGSLIVNGPVECSAVSVSGSIIVKDDLVCDELRVSGSIHVDGNVTCERDMKISGGGTIMKNTQVYGYFKVSGGAKINGMLVVDEGKVTGNLKVTDGIVCNTDFRVSGKLQANALLCHTFKSSGKIKIKDLLEAKTMKLFTSGKSTIGSVKGQQIELLTKKMNMTTDEDTNLILDIIRNVIGPFIENALSSYNGSYLIEGNVYGDHVVLEDTEVMGDVIGDHIELKGETIVHGIVKYTEELFLENESINVTSKKISPTEKKGLA